MISTSGWTQTTQMPAADAIRRLTDRGVRSFVYTNVDRDGKLEADLDEVARWPRPCAGASSTRAASARSRTCGGSPGSPGQPRGRDRRQALYEGRFTITEGRAALDLR